MAPNYPVILIACEENYFPSGSINSCYCCHCIYFLSMANLMKLTIFLYYNLSAHVHFPVLKMFSYLWFVQIRIQKSSTGCILLACFLCVFLSVTAVSKHSVKG